MSVSFTSGTTVCLVLLMDYGLVGCRPNQWNGSKLMLLWAKQCCCLQQLVTVPILSFHEIVFCLGEVFPV
ncbi:hypothetical protein PsorP6_015209 [Peronosclerospora sorghi]|uniref:Uncharacterized protein n=1 Tax=Peronosclerospora sorghi TaxID=230839 RepID=A0ACC0VTQ0_9STRA|nr:hypothetical protein PsorP6_015209 [Peronosclerospora sorghi]